MSDMTWADRLRALYRGNNFLSPSKYDELADHIDSAAVEVERLRSALDEIRGLHVDSPAGFCPSCGRLGDVSDTDDGLVNYPCPTIQAIDAVTRKTTQ